MSKLLENVAAELSKLPGIGKRTALRLSMHLLKMDAEDVAQLTGSMDEFRNKIKYCSCCNNLSDTERCKICEDESRDRSIVCVVENIGDVISIENTRQYHGLYHVLGGVISPMQGVAPSDLKVDLLLDNIAKGRIREVILAVSATVEGETTMFYLSRKLEQFKNIRVTSIARGIGFGDELEYADELTIAHAINNRSLLNNDN